MKALIQNNPSVFNFSVTRNAKSNKITQIICRNFICEKSAPNFMMNVQSFLSKFFFMLSAYYTSMIIPIYRCFSLSLPTIPIIFSWTSFNVHWVIFSTPRKAIAFLGTIFCFSNLIRFYKKFLATLNTNNFDKFYQSYFLTFLRAINTPTIIKSMWLRIKLFFTYFTRNQNFSCSALNLTGLTTIFSTPKFYDNISDLKFFAAYRTNFNNHIKALPSMFGCRCLGGTVHEGSILKNIYTRTEAPRQKYYITYIAQVQL